MKKPIQSTLFLLVMIFLNVMAVSAKAESNVGRERNSRLKRESLSQSACRYLPVMKKLFTEKPFLIET